MIEPNRRGSYLWSTKHRRRKLLKKVGVLAAVLLITGAVWFIQNDNANAPEAPAQKVAVKKKTETKATPKPAPVLPKPQPVSRKLKTFSGAQFQALYESITYPNVQEITGLVNITGNASADARIVAIAESRGYKKRSVPSAPIKKIGNTYPDGDDLLQQLAIANWAVLRDNALASGLDIRILSAYRSPEVQRSIFTNRLYSTGVTAEQIAAGQADAQVNQILVTSSIPGYSRHHTGYTIDLQCNGGSLEAFVNTACHAWISANNFEQAKKTGWIPSYPDGASKQGPEPEPWEFVWVGTDVLYE